MRDWDPKGQPPNDENDDDLDWDWLNDAEQKESGSGEHTGLTGQLDWQGRDEAASNQPESDSDFDWQNPQSSKGKTSSSESGLTGNLDWQKNRFGESSASSETGLTGSLDWQEGTLDSADEDAAAPDASWDDEIGSVQDSENDTLYGWPDGLNVPANARTGDTGELLDWMADPEGTDSESAAPADDIPDWMLDLDESTPAAAVPANAAPVELPDWLSDLDVPQDSPDEPTFESPSAWGNEVDEVEPLESAYEWTPYDETSAEDEPAAWMKDSAANAFEDADQFFDDLPPDFEAAPDTQDDLEFANLFSQNEAVPQGAEPSASDDDSLDDFDFNALLNQDEAADDLTPDDLDFDSLFASASEDESLPAAPAPTSAPDNLNLDAIFAQADDDAADEAWLNEFEPVDQAADADIDFDNFFAEVEDSEADPDHMANIVASGRSEREDWFETSAAGAVDDDPNWLDSLEDISLDDVIDTPPTPAQPAPAARATPSPRQPEIDLDAMFADTDDSPLVTTARGYNTYDLNSFPELPDDMRIAAAEENPDVPEWLREAAASTDDQLSAAGIIRQKYVDRPLESLDDRLKALREMGLNLTSEAAVETPQGRRVLETVLPGVEDTLAPVATVGVAAAALDATLRVTPEQQKNAALLRSLVGQSTAAEIKRAQGRAYPRLAPILRGLAIAILFAAVLVPFFIPITIGNQPDAAFVAGSPGANAFVRVATLPERARVLVAAEYGATGAGELDPLLRVMLTHILSRGAQPVLVSTNPMGMRHAQNILLEVAGEANEGRAYYILGYQPGALLGLRNLDANSNVLFSTDVQGEKLGLNINGLEDLTLAVIVAENAESVQTWIEQTSIGRRVPVVIASSAAALPLIVPYTQQGQVAGVITGYRDAVTYTRMLEAQGPMTVIVPDRPTPIILPTAIPVTPTEIPPTVVPLATQEITVEATEEAVQITAEATEALVVATEISITATPEEVEPTATDTEISVTATPDEPTATDTAAPTASNTATEAPSATPGATSAGAAGDVVEFAVVNAQSNVNTRSGPGTEFDLVRSLTPGTELRVVSYNEDRSWVEIELPNGDTAWIAEFLVRIREVPANEVTPAAPRRSQRPRRPGERIAQAGTPVIPTVDATLLTVDVSLLLTVQAQGTLPAGLIETQAAALTQAAVGLEALTGLPSLDSTALAATASALQTQAAVTLTALPVTPSDVSLTPAASGDTLTLTAPVLPNADSRWNATTLGVGAAIVIIILGNLVAALRALLRRDR